MLAMQASRAGGPEVLEAIYPPLPRPGPDEVVVRHQAIGVNFIDIYHRAGLYPTPFPAAIGLEAAGFIEGIGPAVQGLEVGDRVAYGAGPRGSYAEAHAVAADRVVKLPPAISTRIAAGVMLKGMTAEFLLRRCYRLEPGQTCLVWAAAGGVGSILTRWAKALGASVIGCVGSEAKAEIARRQGCDHVLCYNSEDVAQRVRALTDGRGVEVVYDGVGKVSQEASLSSLARRGMLVSFGNASGAAEPVAPLRLSQGGSLYLTRPTLFDYTAAAAEYQSSAAAVFAAIAAGAIEVTIGAEYALSRAADAHRDLEAGSTTGSILLIP